MTAPLVHMTVLLKKKNGMIKEQFDDYWPNTHADVFMSKPIAKAKLVRYSQRLINIEQTKRLASMGINQPSADGIVHFWARSIDDFMAVFESEYYQKIVMADEKNFMKIGHEEMTIGMDDDKWVIG